MDEREAGGGGRGAGATAAGTGAAGPAGPPMPSVAVLDESLRWPGKMLTLEQTGGPVIFTSERRHEVVPAECA